MIPTITRPLVVSLRRTDVRCPAQWEGKTDSGQIVFIRFRWGRLRWGLGQTKEEAEDAAFMRGQAEVVGADFDHELSDADMQRHLQKRLEFSL